MSTRPVALGATKDASTADRGGSGRGPGARRARGRAAMAAAISKELDIGVLWWAGGEPGGSTACYVSIEASIEAIVQVRRVARGHG